MPPLHRRIGEGVRDAPRLHVREARLRIDAKIFRKSVRERPERGMAGGATYDALEAVAARAHSVELITCDRRAASGPEGLGVRLTSLA